MDHLKKAGRIDVLEVFNHCKNLGNYYISSNSRGFGMKEGALVRHVARIPMYFVMRDPEHRKYFDPRIPYEDRGKEQDRWIKKNDWVDFRKI